MPEFKPNHEEMFQGFMKLMDNIILPVAGCSEKENAKLAELQAACRRTLNEQEDAAKEDAG